MRVLLRETLPIWLTVEDTLFVCVGVLLVLACCEEVGERVDVTDPVTLCVADDEDVRLPVIEPLGVAI